MRRYIHESDWSSFQTVRVHLSKRIMNLVQSIPCSHFYFLFFIFIIFLFFCKMDLEPRERKKEKVQTDPSPPPWPPFVESSGAHICIHRKTRGLGSVVDLALVYTLPRDQSTLPGTTTGSTEYYGQIETGLLYGVPSGLFLCFCILGVDLNDP